MSVAVRTHGGGVQSALLAHPPGSDGGFSGQEEGRVVRARTRGNPRAVGWLLRRRAREECEMGNADMILHHLFFDWHLYWRDAAHRLSCRLAACIHYLNHPTNKETE